MTKKHTVFISACKNYSMEKLGIFSDTPDYQVAEYLGKEIVNGETKVYIKNTLDPWGDLDTQTLSEARILVVVCSTRKYLVRFKDIINEFIKEANIGNSNKVKKIYYVYIEAVGELTKNDISLNKSGKYVVELFGLNSDNISQLSNDIHQYFLKVFFDKNTSTVRQILYEYRSTLADGLTKNPIKRLWLDEILNDWVQSTSRSRILWIQGDHGSGKTIYIGDYCSRLKNVLGKGIYYCKSANSQTQSCERIIKALAYELCEAIPEYATKIENYVTSEKFKNHTAYELFTSLIIEPFQDIDVMKTKGDFFFVIDAIDELKTDKDDKLNDFLRLLHSSFIHAPSFIYLIVTSPKTYEITSSLVLLDYNVIKLNDKKYNRRIKEDAKFFLTSRLDFLNIKYTDVQIDIILTKSSCNFDYLHYFIKQCSTSGQLPDLSELPIGLIGQFQYDFRNRFEIGHYSKNIRPILQVLSDAYEPLSVNDLAQIFEKDISDINTIVTGQLSQFLRFENNEFNVEVVSLYNRSLELWLNDTSHNFCLVNNNKAKEICEWMKRRRFSFVDNDYLRKYGLLHLWENQEEKYIVYDLIGESDENSFEKIKEELAALYILLIKKDDNSPSYFIDFYSRYYTRRIRDILVYTYRYVVSNIEGQECRLQDITDLLSAKYEEVRAKLLIGESIEDYEKAKESLNLTIVYAKSLVDNRNDERHSIWWNRRMLGIAYNRLGRLEAKKGNIDEAIKNYLEGDKYFDQALNIIAEYSIDPVMNEITKSDKKTLERDKAIINERMGDFFCSKGDFSKGKEFYEKYFDYCSKVSTIDDIRSVWDLSTSLLRLGDSYRYLGHPREAYLNYKQALTKRKDILQNLRNDCYEKVFNSKHPPFINFDCPDTLTIPSSLVVDVVPQETRDIDPIRDIAMCYIRLGDLAYSLSLNEVAKKYYDSFYVFCEISDSESKSKLTKKDMQLCIERQNRLQRKE